MTHILIVDDDADNRSIVRSALEGEGHRVDEAEDGILGLEKIREHPPELIISDILMPRLDGFGLCRELKKDPQLRHIPLMFYTATFVEPEDEQLALDLGAARFLIKPQEASDLLAEVHKVLADQPKGHLSDQRIKRTDAVSLHARHEERLSRKLEKKVQDLEASEQRFRTLVENAGSVILVLDPDFILLEFNREAERVFGMPRHQALGHDYRNLFVPEDLRDAITDDARRVMSGKPSRAFKNTVHDIRGNQHLLSWNVDPLDSPRGFIAVGQDITDQARMEKELRESEARYRLMVETAPDAIFIADAATGILLDANTRAIALTGRSRGALIGQPHTILHPPEEEETYRRYFKEHARTGAEDIQYEIQNVGGEHIPVSLRANVCELDDRQVVLGIFRDMREQQRARTALRESEERFESIFRYSPTGITVTSLEGRLEQVNPAFADMLGYSSDELQGMSIEEITFPEDWKSASEHIHRIITTAIDTTSLEKRYLHKNGSPVWAQVLITLVRPSAAKAYLFALVTDITERRRHQEQQQRDAQAVRRALMDTVAAIARTVEKRDPYTAGHQTRVADLARAMARQLRLEEDAITGLHLGALIHDIGKISIPVELLNRPGKLESYEFDLIKTHAQAGFDIVKDTHSHWPLAQMIFQHHERMDGSGYPQGLHAEAILPEARILAVADVVEAMSSHRPYRPGLGLAAALEEIQNNAGTLYDADVVKVCLDLFQRKDYQFPEIVQPNRYTDP